jgi:glycosyltransferase involved in cell wall biosynthesis
MRLFHIADYGGPYSGSFIPMLTASIECASRSGWDCHAVFSEEASDREWVTELVETGVQCHFIPRSRSLATAALAALLDRSTATTILHTHFSAFDLPAVHVAQDRPATHVFWHVHSQLRTRPDAVARNVIRFALLGRNVRGTLCVSPDVTTRVRRRLAHHVVFFPNAINTSRFGLVAADSRRTARLRLGLPEPGARAVLLHFGWDWERKGGPEYLEAVRELVRTGTRLIALTVGGGEQAERHATRLGIGDMVRVLDATEDVRSLYAAADVFVTPARAEGMPFALTEALCSGTAAVASPLAGHRFVGERIDACRICDSEPWTIAQEVTRVLARDPELIQAQSIAAHRWIVKHLGLDTWAQRLTGLYQSVLD